LEVVRWSLAMDTHSQYVVPSRYLDVHLTTMAVEKKLLIPLKDAGLGLDVKFGGWFYVKNSYSDNRKIDRCCHI